MVERVSDSGGKVDRYSVMLAVIILMLGAFGSVSLVYMNRLESVYTLVVGLCSRISIVEEANKHQEQRLDMQRSTLEKLENKTDELKKFHMIK